MYRDFTYYKMNNLDNRITNPDQLLTTDVERFCNSIVELYSNISKPMLDIVIYVQKLAFTIGGQVAHLKFPSRVAFTFILFLTIFSGLGSAQMVVDGIVVNRTSSLLFSVIC